MRGLIRYNIYTMEDKLKLTVVINFIIMFSFSIMGRLNPFFHSWLAIAIIVETASFAVQAGSTLQTDFKSRWNRFEITMPIRRKDVIKARYICFVLYGLIGMAIALLTVGVFYLLRANINIERIFFSLTFGIVLILVVPALMHPLLLIFGIDKVETILTISVVATTALFIVSSVVFNFLSAGLNTPDLSFRIFIIFISGILFMVSYLASIYLYEKKNFERTLIAVLF